MSMLQQSQIQKHVDDADCDTVSSSEDCDDDDPTIISQISMMLIVIPFLLEDCNDDDPTIVSQILTMLTVIPFLHPKTVMTMMRLFSLMSRNL